MKSYGLYISYIDFCIGWAVYEKTEKKVELYVKYGLAYILRHFSKLYWLLSRKLSKI
jgi:hypothetical protein